ncbi:TIGR04372 family glycosyltransferase [Helicobacter cinaedi]|uniref:TIGR04372 family glycosyltransferase n=1 Tax=Helicobacter cinaedi TaxID=213 RepID=UPI000CF06553|nr:TIGR04372 family glycosyltransferase [Helicobacter cinaedi]
MFRKCKDLVKAILPTSVYRLLREGIFRCMGYATFIVKLILFPFAWLYMWVLNLKQPTRVTALIGVRIGHLTLNTDIFVRRQLHKKERIIFIAPRPIANDFLLYRWKDIIEIVTYDDHPFLARFLDTLLLFIDVPAFHGHSNFYAYFSKIILFKLPTRFVFELPYDGDEYQLYIDTQSSFYFTDSEKQEGDRILEEMGIGKNDWFVCVFARDSAYMDKSFGGYDENGVRKSSIWGHHDYRDSDIDSLHLAIDEILSRGGFVVRVGKFVLKPISYKHERVVDYPLSKWRSDFMDIYLQYRAKFILASSTSGATDVCSLFDTPYCGVNIPVYCNIPYKVVTQIPKTYRHKETGEMIGLKEWIRLVEEKQAHIHATADEMCESIWKTDFYISNKLEIIDNTPEEILELTREMFERLDGNFLQTQEDKMLQKKYLDINQTYPLYRESKNPYGRDFLAKNPWFLEEYK